MRLPVGSQKGSRFSSIIMNKVDRLIIFKMIYDIIVFAFKLLVLFI